MSAVRLRSIAKRLLGASTLCAISSVGPGGRAHINTAYFAWSSAFEIVWLSAPEARHSRNIRSHPAVAIAVYDSTQKWGGSDRGVQMFGTAHEVNPRDRRDAERLYGTRFKSYSGEELQAYRFYRFRARTLKLFHERELGGATFVTAKVARDGHLAWDRTETYER
jgi:nitroimidazol reductase NimA-like FMN-containing flavoprotein (pyridoxamine 5'-phosphate oxidase superfamily)